jgi:membrane protease YdiL (CAAX protease family)
LERIKVFDSRKPGLRERLRAPTFSKEQEAKDIMKSFIRSLPSAAEFCLILLICFGWAAYSNVSYLLQGAKAIPVHMGDGRVLGFMCFELAAIAAVVWIGHIRGWSVTSFGLRITWKGTGGGLPLLIGSLVALTVQNLLLNVIHPVTGNATILTGSLSLYTVILMSLINPVFEELMEVGYFVHALKRYGMWPAVLASAGFRACLHAYTGVNGAAGVLLLGVIFGLVYWKWRQLWPLILVHAIIDFIALHNLASPA